MMRITGIVVGICITVATFLLMLNSGKQQETLTETIADPTHENFSAIVTAIAEQVDIAQAENESEAPVPPGSLYEAPEKDIPEEPSDPPGHVTSAPDEQPLNDIQISGMDLDQRAINGDSNNTGTYLFWSPFRSTWAAQGFASRLTLSTQVPVDVISTGPGKYHVVFSYRDETERLSRIERIESITGLKLE